MKAKLLIPAAMATLAGSAIAQTYTPVLLREGSSANTISGGISGGQRGMYEAGRATLWDINGNYINVHPSFLSTSAGPGFSNVLGKYGNTTVGLGQRHTTPNQAVAIRWVGTTPSVLPSPFPIYSSVALATDGVQIVGWASPMQTVNGQPSPGLMRALIWDAKTGAFQADLSNGRLVTAYSVARGQQVGSSNVPGEAEARLWRGTAASAVNLHPENFDISEAYATDGTRQVGAAGTSVRVVDESRHGAEVMMYSAGVWSGTAASFTTLPFTMPGYNYSTAIATGISGNRVCGVGMGKSRTGVTLTTHALVWNLTSRTWIDLHNRLPIGFKQSRANAVDAAGNVTGYAVDANGYSRAVLWKV